MFNYINELLWLTMSIPVIEMGLLLKNKKK